MLFPENIFTQTKNAKHLIHILFSRMSAWIRNLITLQILFK